MFNINEYMKERYNRRRQDAIAKLGGKCVECGVTEDLHFDHLNPKNKTMNVSKMLASGPKESVDSELEKCQLLCASCHKEKHACVHGSLRKYSNGCRCDLCRLKWNKHSNAYRRERRAEKRRET